MLEKQSEGPFKSSIGQGSLALKARNGQNASTFNQNDATFDQNPHFFQNKSV